MPAASIIMPCYNSAPYLRDSVAGILGQSFKDFELVVVDDASTDDSGAILRELAERDSRISLLAHDRNYGASRSRNDGLRYARGDYVGFCDADDIWKPEKLERQIDLLRRHPGSDITYCESEIIDGDGKLTGNLFNRKYPLPRHPSGELFEELCAKNFINMQTVLMRRQPIGDRIFFDESIKLVEDWWQWIRLSRHHRFVYDPQPLAFYRIHAGSSDRNRVGIHTNRWKVCKRNLRAHPDLPFRLQALLWYQMAVELSLLGRRRAAARFLRRAARFAFSGGSSLRRLLTIGGRTAVASLRGLIAN